MASKAATTSMMKRWRSKAAVMAAGVIQKFNSRSTRGNTVKCDPSIEMVDGCLFKGETGWRALFRLETTGTFFTRTIDNREAILSGLSSMLAHRELRNGRIYSTSQPYSLLAKTNAAKRLGHHKPDDTAGIQAHYAHVDREVGRIAARKYRVRVWWLEVDLDDHRLTGDDTGLTEELYDVGVSKLGVLHPYNHRLISKALRALDVIRLTYPGARIALRDEVLKLVLRSNWRGVEEPPEPQFEEHVPIREPSQLAWLGQGYYVPDGYSIETRCLGRKGFASYLTLGGLPAVIPLGTYPFFHCVDSTGSPVDVTVEYTVLSKNEAIQRLDDQQAIITAWRTSKLGRKLGDADSPAALRKEQAIQEARQAVERGEVQVEFHATAAVTGATRELCELNAQYVIDTSANHYPGTVWFAPLGIQRELHEQCIPGNPWKIFNYVRNLPLDGLAAGGLGITDVPSMSGNTVGRLTGRDRGPGQINLASTITRGSEGPTLTAVFGMVGAGKTTGILEIGHAMAHDNVIVLYREGAHTETENIKWDLRPDPPPTEVLDVSRMPGCFNAFWWGETSGEQASNGAAFLYSMLKTTRSEDDRELIYDVVKDYVDEHPDGVRDYQDVVRILRGHKNPDYQRIGVALRELCDIRGTGIFVGTREQAQYLFEHLKPGFIVWRNSAWKLPDPDSNPKDWTSEQRLAVAGIGLQYPFSRELGRMRGVPTLVIDDEFQATAQLPGGMQYLFDDCTTGRKYDSMRLIGTPVANPAVVPTWCRQYTSWVIVFRAKTVQDAIWSAEYLGFENPEDPVVVQRIMSLGLTEKGTQDPLRRGECLVRNPNGDIYRMCIERTHIGEAFDPKLHRDNERKAQTQPTSSQLVSV